jgi:phage tail sheath protein FI
MDCLHEMEARGDMLRIAPIVSVPTAGLPITGIPVVRPVGAIPTPAVPQWKYVSIRRLTIYLEASLRAGTQWVVFEPNGPALWAEIRINVATYMQTMFLQGAFQGVSPQQAYFVKCDSESNTQADINEGVVNIVVGFAPQYPAEFVVIQISQLAEKPPP